MIDKCWALHGKPITALSKSLGSDEAKVNAVHVETASVAVESALTIRAMTLKREGWLWDSGTSTSMTPDISLLHNIRALSKPTRVRLRDRRLIHANMQGDLLSHINVNNHEIDLFFPGVLHIPGLGQNLLSLNTILNNGYRINSNQDGFVVQQEEGRATLLI